MPPGPEPDLRRSPWTPFGVRLPRKVEVRRLESRCWQRVRAAVNQVGLPGRPAAAAGRDGAVGRDADHEDRDRAVVRAGLSGLGCRDYLGCRVANRGCRPAVAAGVVVGAEPPRAVAGTCGVAGAMIRSRAHRPFSVVRLLRAARAIRRVDRETLAATSQSPSLRRLPCGWSPVGRAERDAVEEGEVVVAALQSRILGAFRRPQRAVRGAVRPTPVPRRRNVLPRAVAGRRECPPLSPDRFPKPPNRSRERFPRIRERALGFRFLLREQPRKRAHHQRDWGGVHRGDRVPGRVRHESGDGDWRVSLGLTLWKALNLVQTSCAGGRDCRESL